MVRGIHKLFVSNLPFVADKIVLKKYLENLGLKVFSANVIFDKKTGLSQKYGFVEISRNQLPILEEKDHIIEGKRIYFQSAQ